MQLVLKARCGSSEKVITGFDEKTDSSCELCTGLRRVIGADCVSLSLCLDIDVFVGLVLLKILAGLTVGAVGVI